MLKYSVLLILLTIAFGIEQASAISYEEMESEIESVFNQLEMTGLGIAVVKNDSIVYHKSFGYKTLPDTIQSGVTLENDDIFRIASISKTFVATAILQLMEQGKLNIDDNAETFLPFPLRNPNFPNDSITIKMLLTHTSSINDNRSWWNINYIDATRDTAYNQCFSKTMPGELYKYCNMNYTLLGAVIEGASGQRFYEYIDQCIMKPLNIGGGFNCNNLDSTKFVHQYRYKDNLGYYVEDDETYRPYSKYLGQSYVLGRTLGLVYPASGMKISTGNLARYMMMHMNYGELDGRRIISEDSEKLMQENYVGKYNYGLSYRQYTDLIDGAVLHGQTGGGNGLKGAMIFDSKEKIGFVILCSGSRSRYIDGYGDIHRPLIKLLYTGLFKQ